MFALCATAGATEVAIDIGHSFNRPGVTSASGAREFDLNKQLGDEVAARLASSKISTNIIGADGRMDTLTDRTAAAKSDLLFVSLHHDSIHHDWMPEAHQFKGFALFVSRKNADAAGSLTCARLIGARLIAAGFAPSRYHSFPIPGENRPFADQRYGVHYYDGLAVLRTANQPAVLIEAGVVVNPEDERRVTSAAGRARIASAIASGIADCRAAQRKL